MFTTPGRVDMVLGKILEDTMYHIWRRQSIGTWQYVGTGHLYWYWVAIYWYWVVYRGVLGGIGSGWYIRGQCSTIGGEAQPQGPPLTVSNHPMRPWTLQRSCK